MKLSPYASYRPSGVEWLGEVPEHWKTTRLRRLARLKSGETITSDDIEDHGEYPVFGGNGIRGYSSQFTHSGHYALIGRQGALCGNINYASGQFWASEHAVVVLPVTDFSTVWMGELLRTMDLNQYSTSAAQPGLSVDRIAALEIPVPPRSEQDAIANFLGRETANIDTLVAKKRTLIERLKEKRTALISRTVTRGLPPDAARSAGLNPHPRLKPSGIEWLGDVPEHWRVKRLKHLLLARKGAIKTGPFGSQLHSSEMLENDIKVFNQKTVIDRDIRGGDNYISFEKFGELSAFEVYPGDLLVTTRGTIGRCMIVPAEAERGILHPCLMRIQLDFRQAFDRYLEIIIQESGRVLEQLQLMSNATTIDVIYSESLKEVWLAMPPITEQHAIVDFLHAELASVDAILARVEAAVERLREYRTALITAAVTGKIDVRGAVA